MSILARVTRTKALFSLKVFGAILIYVATVQFLSWFVANHPDSRWAWVAAVLPIAAVALVTVAAMSSLDQMDEREWRMHLEAMAFAYLASFLVLGTYTFLVYVGVMKLALEMFMPMMVMLWVAGLARSLWKYR